MIRSFQYVFVSNILCPVRKNNPLFPENGIKPVHISASGPKPAAAKLSCHFEQNSSFRLFYSSTVPSIPTVTVSNGISVPACSNAFRTTMTVPPQQGTSMRAIVMDLIRC